MLPPKVRRVSLYPRDTRHSLPSTRNKNFRQSEKSRSEESALELIKNRVAAAVPYRAEIGAPKLVYITYKQSQVCARTPRNIGSKGYHLLEIEKPANLQPPCREAPRLDKKFGEPATPL